MALPPQILGFGAISIDEIIYVDRPLSAGQGKVTNRIISHGGNIATALVAAAALGSRSSFIGWLSKQPEYTICASELHKHGVDTSFAPLSFDARPIRSVITVGADGDRFIAYDDDLLHGTSEQTAIEALRQAQILMIDGYAISSLDIVKKARDIGLQIVADIEWSKDAETQQLIELSDHLVLPWDFAAEATNQNQPVAILQSLWSDERKSVVLTKGKEGTFLLESDGSSAWHIPAHEVEVVDTTGAGDCFHGAFASALVSEKPLLKCVQYASTAAAISVTGHGGRGALPSHEACISLLADDSAPKPMAL